MNNRERGKHLAIRYYTKKDRRKLRAFNHDFVLPQYFKELIGDKKSVLIADLGAGSICTLGNQWPGVELKILASDLLADEYNEIWTRTRRAILNPVTKQDMEALTYPDNYFDIVHCVNALDHCENPRAAIAEMIRVCKPGGWVYLRHIPHEGANEGYSGFHQWDVDFVDGECLFSDRRGVGFPLVELGDFTSEIKTEISNSIYPGEESVVSKMRKADRRTGAPSRRVNEVYLNLEHFPGRERRVGMLDRRGAIQRRYYKSYLMGAEASSPNNMTPEGLFDGEVIVGNEVVTMPKLFPRASTFREQEHCGIIRRLFANRFFCLYWSDFHDERKDYKQMIVRAYDEADARVCFRKEVKPDDDEQELLIVEEIKDTKQALGCMANPYRYDPQGTTRAYE